MNSHLDSKNFMVLHKEASGKDTEYHDKVTNEKFIPHVVEPTFGLDRSVLITLLDKYTEEEAPTADGKTEKRLVMKFPVELAPVKIAVLPLSKKDELVNPARKLFNDLSAKWNCEFDITQSIGRRYRRQDEIGTPFAVTFDFDSLEDKKVTVIQEPPFVLTWYDQYSSAYKPVLVLGYAENKRLVGLMPLARSLRDGRLTHAGDWQAEYHGWVCDPDFEQDFPVQALIAMKAKYNPKCWHWRWLPPRTQNDWLCSSCFSVDTRK